ncbi:Uncharacterised protein [Mycobacteroides abscessus subsp. massiliense]|nr:Uncharacterised protein [Mycobacteroides abscessus subsp. massiliense]SKN80435.1 Uncharacterised protein [Mycobacteroides abscessus subsp. massiliense]SKO00255.1 Uncharacterised protein [Mycobacteroides abscessus subsp. massiliense]SKO49330.1 Uncharacterised protein [Mycobacteroides abscessus subsp. massiliense]SKT23497.1 Uncharacterised protein [Mycobacteroides abscessus subsp. massiliense]
MSKDWTCQGRAHTDEPLARRPSRPGESPRPALGHPPQALPQPPAADICCAAVVYWATCQAAAPTVTRAAAPHTVSPTKPIVVEPNSAARPPAGRPPPRAQPAARRGRWSRWRRSAPAQFRRGTKAVTPRAVPVAPARARWAGVANPGRRAPARPARWDRRLRALRRRVWRAHRVRRPDRRVRWGRLPGR